MFRQQYPVREISFSSDFWRIGRAILLAASFLLLLAFVPSSHAQARCRPWSGGVYYSMSGSFISGFQPLYRNSSCSPPSVGTISFGSHGAVDAFNRQSAIDKCNSHNSGSNYSVSAYGSLWSCNPGDDDEDSDTSVSGGGGSGGSGSAYRRAEIHVTKLALGSVMVNAELGLNSGIQFQRMDHYGVGIQSVVEMGVLDVVDVWGHANQYFEVCFPLAGKVVFLDAATSPRTVVTVTNFKRDGYSCASMNRAGTMVLVEPSVQSSATDQAIAQSFIDSTTDPVSSAISLASCQITPQHHLNLRDEPWGQVLTVVPKHTTVNGTARTQSWFKVTFTAEYLESSDIDDQAESIEGWIAAWLSESEGDCGWDVEDDDGPALASSRFLAQDESFSIT